MKNQESADHYLQKATYIEKLADDGHYGGTDTDGHTMALGRAAAFREVGRDLCEHKITVDAAGIGPMCRVCGKQIEETERGD